MDLFGHEAPRAPFKDIRPQRDYVAEEKATLCLQLGELCRKVPPSIQSGDIKSTRESGGLRASEEGSREQAIEPGGVGDGNQADA